MIDELLTIPLLKQYASEVYKNPILQIVAVTQAVHESGLLRKEGASELALKYKNLFGIKKVGTDGHVMVETHEYIKGKKVQRTEKFGKNLSYLDSFKQHKKLLSKWRYRKVRKCYSVVQAFEELYKAGYATDPKYPQKLYNVFYKLY